MACSLGNCTNEGKWRPVLELRTRKNGPVTRAAFGALAYCDGHKQHLEVANVLSDEGFVKIAKHMRECGKKAPIKRNTTLAFVLIPPQEIALLAPSILAAQPADDSLPF